MSVFGTSAAGLPVVAPPVAGGRDSGHAGSDFLQTLKDAFGAVNSQLLQADESSRMLAAGKVTDLHDVMITAEKANLALQLTIQVRNKVLEAYQEIMRMPV